MTIHTAIAAPVGAIALERLTIILGTSPDFEKVVTLETNGDNYYDKLAEQDLELTLADMGIPS